MSLFIFYLLTIFVPIRNTLLSKSKTTNLMLMLNIEIIHIQAARFNHRIKKTHIDTANFFTLNLLQGWNDVLK